MSVDPSTQAIKLLVSVSSAVEARAALDGGADIIDAKDPSAGALGMVSRSTLHEIASVVGTCRPVSAALGDGCEEADVERAAFACASAGAAFVKIGFASTTDPARVARLLTAAVSGVQRQDTHQCGVVAATYAETEGVGSPSRSGLVDIAARVGAVGVLMDTADKRGPGLRQLITTRDLTTWVRRAHDLGLFVALAGKISVDDLDWVGDCGADVAGVRGAACEGGRNGRVTVERVRRLSLAVGSRRWAVAVSREP